MFFRDFFNDLILPNDTPNSLEIAFDKYDEKKIQELYFWSKKKIKKEQFEKIVCAEI